MAVMLRWGVVDMAEMLGWGGDYYNLLTIEPLSLTSYARALFITPVPFIFNKRSVRISLLLHPATPPRNPEKTDFSTQSNHDVFPGKRSPPPSPNRFIIRTASTSGESFVASRGGWKPRMRRETVFSWQIAPFWHSSETRWNGVWIQSTPLKTTHQTHSTSGFVPMMSIFVTLQKNKRDFVLWTFVTVYSTVFIDVFARFRLVNLAKL